MLLSLALAATLALPPITSADPVTWKVDPVHSELTFRIRHFVTKVFGTFKSWSGTIVADPAKLSTGSVEVAVETATIDTRNERRDTDLRSPNFFDSFPAMTFKSTKVEANGSALKITGDLTIRGITKPVVLTGEYLGTMGLAEPMKQRIGFTATAKINRLDYGLKWNRVVEGSNMLGDEVEININIEALRQ
jgi:polyisoprenoid-binding protein YceI